MYYDLFLPYPTPEVLGSGNKKNKKDKGKIKAAASPAPVPASNSPRVDCWTGLSASERAGVARSVALAGHLGYTVVAHTVVGSEAAHTVLQSPFGTPETRALPFPSLDPRFIAILNDPVSTTAPGPSQCAQQPTLVQVTRFQMRLDDMKTHPITAGNTTTLRDYDLLGAYVTSDKALQLACTELALPGPNQLSIITVPLHERSYHFRLNRKQIRQAQRNGVVFEILYAAGLFPPRSVPPDAARRYRQNFLSNARELVRVTGGRGLILSSGPGGSLESARAPLDVVNLATILGMPANLAKDAVCRTPKMLLLRAQARRTYKAVMSSPRVVPPPGVRPSEESAPSAVLSGVKRAALGEAERGMMKKIKS